MEPEQVRNIMDSMIRKLYDMELEDGAAGRMKNYCQKSENFWKRTRLLSRWKIKLDVRALIWRLQLQSWEKKSVLHRDLSVLFNFFWNVGESR